MPEPDNHSYPRISSDCLSDLQLDWFAQARMETGGVLAHLGECTRCKERLALFRTAREQSASSVESLLHLAKARVQHQELASTSRWWWIGLGIACTVAAVAMFFVVTRGKNYTEDGKEQVARHDISPNQPGVRSKGTAMRFFWRRDGQVTKGASQEVLRAGDALRFVITTGTETHFLLIGVEEFGRISAYYPFGGSGSLVVGPGSDIALPDSLVLDESKETEHFIGFFSDQPIVFDDLSDAVQAALAETQNVGASLDALSFVGTMHRVSVRRE